MNSTTKVLIAGVVVIGLWIGFQLMYVPKLDAPASEAGCSSGG